MNKTAILKSSPFTSGLTRALKGSTTRLHCNASGNDVYLTNGYFLVKLTPTEYDVLARPVTQRDAGNWVLNEDGTPDASNPIDLVKLLDDAAKKAVHAVTAAPMLFELPNGKSKIQLIGYYSETGDFVTAFNPVYASVSASGLEHKSSGSINPMVVYNAGEPIAMILPVKITDKPYIIRTVRAWFVDSGSDAKTKASKTAENLRHHAEELEAAVKQYESENAELRRQLEGLRQQYAEQHIEANGLREQIEALTARLNVSPAPEESIQSTEQTPAGKAAALVYELTALEGVTAVIKGAQTAAPVVWLAGETDAHKDKIERMGGKWSGKRSAWYIKVI